MNLTTSVSNRDVRGSKRNWLKWMGGAALAPVLAASTATRAAPGPRAGYFPNSIVQTHDGRKLRFYDDVVRGKIVVFNMMYTVCTGICPGNTANLLQVQQALGSRRGAGAGRRRYHQHHTRSARAACQLLSEHHRAHP